MHKLVPWHSLYSKNCPPSTAIDSDESPVYRLVKNKNQLNIADFAPHRWISPAKYPNKCDLCATSVFNDLKKAKKVMMMPNIRKKGLKDIAEGSIQCGDGKLQYDKNNHINWWIITHEPHLQFKATP